MIACVGETRGRARGGGDRGGAPPPGRAIARARDDEPRDRLRARVGDRHRQDGDARDGAGGTRDRSSRCSTCRCSTAARSSRRTPPSCSRSRTSTARSSAAPRSTSTRSPRFAAQLPARSARHPRRLGLRAGRARATPSSSPTRRCSTGSGASTRTRRSRPRARRPACRPGQMGNTEVGHLTIGSGRRLYQDLMRVNQRDRRRLVLRRTRSLRARSSRGKPRAPARARLARRRALAHRPPAGAAALRAGEDVDPRVHRRPRRLAARGARDLAELPARADRDGRRPLLRDGPRPAAGSARSARSTRSRAARDATRERRPSPRCRRATTPASPTSSSSRSWSTGAPRLEPGDTAIFFNFRPDRGRQLTRSAARRRLRPDDDDALRVGPRLPVVFAEQTVAEDARRGARRSTGCSSCTSRRRRSTRT